MRHINYDDMLRKLDLVEDNLIKTNEEFKRLMDETLDLYNDGGISKKSMQQMMEMGERSLKDNKQAMKDVAGLREKILKEKGRI